MKTRKVISGAGKFLLCFFLVLAVLPAISQAEDPDTIAASLAPTITAIDWIGASTFGQ